MASAAADAFLKGLVGGFTTSQDASRYGFATEDVASKANGVASTEQDANGEGLGKDYGIGSNSGTRYGYVRNDRGSQIMTMLAHYANTYLETNGDSNAAVQAGSQAVQDHNDMAWRSRQAEMLDGEGYDPLGINQWVKTGENKDLVTGQGQMIVTDPSTGKKIRVSAEEARAMQEQKDREAQQTVANKQWEEGHQLDVQNTNYNTSKPIVTMGQGETAVMPDQSVVQTAPKTTNAGGANSVNGGAMTWTDPETGEQGVVAVNSRGTPLIDNKSGFATVKMANGQVRQVNINEVRMNAAGLAASTALTQLDRIENSNDAELSGGWGIKRTLGELAGQSTSSNLGNDINALNNTIGTLVTQQLVTELGGRQPNASEIETAKRKFGLFNKSLSTEQWKTKLEEVRGLANTIYNQATSGNPNQTVSLQNPRNPTERAPTTPSQAANVPAPTVHKPVSNGTYKTQGGSSYTVTVD